MRESTRSPGRNAESPGSATETRRSIWRTISSMCLSWIDTPWSRYTFCTSSTRYCWVSRMPLISSSSLGSFGPSTSASPAVTSWPSVTSRWARARRCRLSSTAVVADDGDAAAVLLVGDADHARRAGQDGLALRGAGLEQLDDAGQTVGDVLTGDTAGVEGPHGQLRAGLADGLGGDDADRLAELDVACRWPASGRSSAAQTPCSASQVSTERTRTRSTLGSSRRAIDARRRRSSVPAGTAAGVPRPAPGRRGGSRGSDALARPRRARCPRARCRGWCRSRPRG